MNKWKQFIRFLIKPLQNERGIFGVDDAMAGALIGAGGDIIGSAIGATTGGQSTTTYPRPFKAHDIMGFQLPQIDFVRDENGKVLDSEGRVITEAGREQQLTGSGVPITVTVWETEDGTRSTPAYAPIGTTYEDYRKIVGKTGGEYGLIMGARIYYDMLSGVPGAAAEFKDAVTGFKDSINALPEQYRSLMSPVTEMYNRIMTEQIEGNEMYQQEFAQYEAEEGQQMKWYKNMLADLTQYTQKTRFEQERIRKQQERVQQEWQQRYLDYTTAKDLNIGFGGMGNVQATNYRGRKYKDELLGNVEQSILNRAATDATNLQGNMDIYGTGLNLLGGRANDLYKFGNLQQGLLGSQQAGLQNQAALAAQMAQIPAGEFTLRSEMPGTILNADQSLYEYFGNNLLNSLTQWRGQQLGASGQGSNPAVNPAVNAGISAGSTLLSGLGNYFTQSSQNSELERALLLQQALNDPNARQVSV